MNFTTIECAVCRRPQRMRFAVAVRHLLPAFSVELEGVSEYGMVCAICCEDLAGRRRKRLEAGTPNPPSALGH